MSDLLIKIETEVDKRIEIIEEPGYEPVPAIGKVDLILASILCIASLVIMIYAYNVLC